jgi:hypothetical protein
VHTRGVADAGGEAGQDALSEGEQGLPEGTAASETGTAEGSVKLWQFAPPATRKRRRHETDQRRTGPVRSDDRTHPGQAEGGCA